MVNYIDRLDTFVARLVAPFPMIPAEYDTKKAPSKGKGKQKFATYVYSLHLKEGK